MRWDDQLLDKQRIAASHTGSHSRLLAGPGTGKTLVITRRILYLIQELSVAPDDILILTFTRAAAQELRNRIKDSLPEDTPQPRIYTLHSFALRQLLLNSDKLDHLPSPLRIADDWEERHIIQEDLKTLLSLNRIRDVQELFNQLSADWQTLSAESGQFSPDPQFIGAWQEHRSLFGYTLRSELVYQLKRCLEQIPDFQLEATFQHLLVDEYQDLNKCDLAIINALTNQGPELFISGDDDQSIYGFRKAHPQGIRAFLDEYPNAKDLPINICKRCDSDILALAEFVADLDINRIPKGTKTPKDTPSGEVILLNFRNQYEEAEAIASLCSSLIFQDGYAPSEILILSRINTNNSLSIILEKAFQRLSIPLSVDVSGNSPLDTDVGRLVLSIMRLLRNISDHLSWRTILKLRRNQIGDGIIGSLLDECRIKGLSFFELLIAIEEESVVLDRYNNRIKQELDTIKTFVNSLVEKYDIDNFSNEEFISLSNEITNWVTDDTEVREEISTYINDQIREAQITSLIDALLLLETTGIDIEQEIDRNSVNMLTMHKAKGLTSEAVIVLACEDEIIPGRDEREPDLGDERRLLFVSLSRAKHKLFVSYCTNRIRQQSYLGRNPGTTRRTLSRFLRYAPIKPVSGVSCIQNRKLQS
ncbi:MAG: ATP-dependent helicase [Candidatus Helarchaeota archaeon]